jgi:tRNA(fMet)-specific endonuclease VapC
VATILLDTNIASLLHPQKVDRRTYDLYRPHLENNVHAISFQTVAELLFWPEKNNWGNAARTALDVLIASLVVIPYEYELARMWAVIRAIAERSGRRLEAGDAWIAATAIVFSIPLVTHDRDLADRRIPDLDVICLA